MIIERLRAANGFSRLGFSRLISRHSSGLPPSFTDPLARRSAGTCRNVAGHSRLPCLLLTLLVVAPVDVSARSRPLDAIELSKEGDRPRSISALLGTGYRVLIFTKPWAKVNESLVRQLVTYRTRLNEAPLKTGLIFVRSRLDEARAAAVQDERRYPVHLDREGRAAGAFNVDTLPTILLISPSNQEIYRTTFLVDDILKQLAANYRDPSHMKAPDPNQWTTPDVPAPTGGSGRHQLQ